MTSWKRFKNWVNRKYRGEELTKSSIEGNFGFKSIQKKSVQFTNARFREQLMEIALLCSENAIDNFI